MDNAKTVAQAAGLKVHQDGDGAWYWYRTADTDENEESFTTEAEAWQAAAYVALAAADGWTPETSEYSAEGYCQANHLLPLAARL